MFKVFRLKFNELENFLNSLEVHYPGFGVYELFPFDSYSGLCFVVILIKYHGGSYID